MDLQAIEMEAGAARKALLDYKRDLKESRERARTDVDRELAAVDAAVMRGYRELGKGHRVIELSKVIAAGGLVEIDVAGERWDTQRRRYRIATAALAPALCVTRADARQGWTKPLQPSASTDPRLRFHADSLPRSWERSSKKDVVEMPVGQVFDLEVELANRGWTYDADERFLLGNTGLKCMAPTIPPVFRPPHALRNYHLLWEAEWTVGYSIPPGDPALLKHLGGDMFAVLAVWDLSPLEKAALAQVRA